MADDFIQSVLQLRQDEIDSYFELTTYSKPNSQSLNNWGFKKIKLTTWLLFYLTSHLTSQVCW